MSEESPFHPDAALWLERILSEEDPSQTTPHNSDALIRGQVKQAHRQNWNPQSLKQICSHAMALGVASGHTTTVMKLLADNELRLSRLRDHIGISRKAGPDELIRASVLLVRQSDWISPGRWIPDILDRAAAFDPISTACKVRMTGGASLEQSHLQSWSDQKVSHSDLEAGNLQHLILLSEPAQELQPAEITREKIQELRQRNPNVQVHLSQMPKKWLSSGPGVFDAVFEAAFLIHGIKD